MTRYDVLVVGAGHAGIEASTAAHRMGARVCVLTSNLDRIGHMSCNPAIGGQGKGQLVKEIDVLGGEMARAIDATGIQFRQLNTSKGPAVRSSRAQADSALYPKHMKNRLESLKMFHVKQGLADTLLFHENRCIGVRTAMGEEVLAGAVILTTGTFLNGLIHIGTYTEPAGRAGDAPSVNLSKSLKSLGFRVGRLKTGTVPRLDGKSINFNNLEMQRGDSPPPLFSFYDAPPLQPQIECAITYTTKETHEIVRNNLTKSAMYSGAIQSKGPRYCPCIEDKITRFSDKPRHQIFLEPMGLSTHEYYPNGLSNSLPYDIQVAFLRTIPGLESVEVMRPGYAIEYDFVDPTELFPSLETKKIPGLFFAGQINGTTGYEEAAGQGIMAGINAVLSLDRKDPLVLKRSEAYIGVMIDDLVTKGTLEPYRMFTARAEHRLWLREDNADQRLHEHAWRLGLVRARTNDIFQKKWDAIRRVLHEMDKMALSPNPATLTKLRSLGTGPIKKKTLFKDLFRRPEVGWTTIDALDSRWSELPRPVREQVEISIKYEGYIEKELHWIARSQKAEDEEIPDHVDFESLPSLSVEVREKLTRIRPRTLGQASRIAGVTPAAISVLSVYMRQVRSLQSTQPIKTSQ